MDNWYILMIVDLDNVGEFMHRVLASEQKTFVLKNKNTNKN